MGIISMSKRAKTFLARDLKESIFNAALVRFQEGCNKKRLVLLLLGLQRVDIKGVWHVFSHHSLPPRASWCVGKVKRQKRKLPLPVPIASINLKYMEVVSGVLCNFAVNSVCQRDSEVF